MAPDNAQAPGQQTQTGTTEASQAPATTSSQTAPVVEPEWKKGYDGLRSIVNRQGTVLSNIERTLAQIANNGNGATASDIQAAAVQPNMALEEIRLNQAKLDLLVSHPEARERMAEIDAIIYDSEKVQPFAAYLPDGRPNYAKVYRDVYDNFEKEQLRELKVQTDAARVKAEEGKERLRQQAVISGDSASEAPQTITRDMLKGMSAADIAKKFGHLMGFDPKDPPSHLR